MINDASSKPFERLFRTFSRKSKEFQKKDTLITMSSVAGSKRRIDNKSCKIKYKALKALEKGTAPKDVAKEFKIPPSTLSTWKKNKEKIYKQFNNGQTSKRSKPEKFKDVNKAVHKWLLMMRSENIPISGPMLKEKALEFAEALGVESFQASQGWMAKWKTRYGVSFKTIAGESRSVTEEMTAPWSETTLPTILSRYPLEDIFNADEFGLFFQCLPNKTLHMKGDKCSEGKYSKVRLTGLAAGNALGERLPMFVIGKSANPRCFKGVKTLPCRYRSQKKSWMSGELFEEWVRELDPDLSTEDFIDFDIEVSTSHGRLKTADIITEITGTQDEELEEVDEEDKEEEDKITRPTAEQVRTAINVLEDLSIFSHFGEEMIASLRDLNRNIAKDFDMSCKQTVITDIFSK
ncbi:tigger transposable element-derived protein 6-like [Hydractinia symbiolongicarpus]|uniref:tigger transposable element-derived protein 6-like n=1 Tax=Hydractinia symbiolongicarpus TaxID=13093 RepID=UPI00254AA7F4|nr:tigger transposable element-derived protein 6-like [Hydractinia symbiolongicarpus]